ncbi:Sec-independent protein translocase protein TatC [bioreactor metagenome]|uniref:Sec-independent protein translocase protein TatC n=1 Tax=bioreactor metagenome TaxID=1076179 RepID=A0A644YIA3_9ZZZZ
MEDEDLSFWDHLHELRKFLIRSILVFILLFIAAFSFREILFDRFLFRLLEPDFITYQWFTELAALLGVGDTSSVVMKFHLINIKLAGQFTAHISISALAAGILTLPFLVYQLWLFIKPALYANERKIIARNAIVIVFLFLIGCAFAYFIITPLSVLFLGNYEVSNKVSNTISLSSYMSVFNSTMFLTGILFELPVLLIVLSRIGIASAGALRRYRKHAVVAGLTLSAIITPTTDPFTMTIVAVPIYLLYEMSIASVSRMEKRRGKN